MRQLQLFTKVELAAMRDRTKSRNYSPARDAFRREHERHRAWGLAQRHAERLRRIRESGRDRSAASPDGRRETPAPARMPAPAPAPAQMPARAPNRTPAPAPSQR